MYSVRPVWNIIVYYLYFLNFLYNEGLKLWREIVEGKILSLNRVIFKEIRKEL